MVLVPIVDEQDNIIGHKERDEVDVSKELWRIAAFWLTNTKGEVLLARRAYTKKHQPGRWGFVTTGAVEKDESYEDTIRREIVEELGVHDLEITLGPKFLTRPNERGYQFFCQYFFATKDIPLEDFHVDPLEVAEIRWLSVSQLLDDLAKNPHEYLNDGLGWKEWIQNNHPF